jgi:hypothetical protein
VFRDLGIDQIAAERFHTPACRPRLAPVGGCNRPRPPREWLRAHPRPALRSTCPSKDAGKKINPRLIRCGWCSSTRLAAAPTAAPARADGQSPWRRSLDRGADQWPTGTCQELRRDGPPKVELADLMRCSKTDHGKPGAASPKYSDRLRVRRRVGVSVWPPIRCYSLDQKTRGGWVLRSIRNE